MGKRELRALERERQARHDARVAVFAALWAQPAYKRLSERLDRLNKLVTQAELYAPATVDLARARFKRLHRRLQKIEDSALKAAGLWP